MFRRHPKQSKTTKTNEEFAMSVDSIEKLFVAEELKDLYRLEANRKPRPSRAGMNVHG